MNLHPSVLAHAAFLDRPHSQQDVGSVIGLIEERISLVKGREASHANSASSGRKVTSTRENSRVPSVSVKCWNCGRLGHVKRYCRHQPLPSEKGAAPGGPTTPGRGS
jgi:hypothetical protein